MNLISRAVVPACLLLCAITLPVDAQTAPAAAAVPDAHSVAARAIGMMAGEAWEKARHISFTFAVEREGKIVTEYPQRWDRYTGMYAVSGRDRDGHAFDVEIDVNTKKGRAVVDGQPSDDPKWTELAYRRFINDTYWLLMPLKMLDPGTHLEHSAVKTDDCGRTYDVLRLTFDEGVGLTPKDQYWPWVSRDTGIVDRWDMLLQSAKPGDAPTTVTFREFRRVGGLLISTRREMGSTAILLRDLTVTP